MGVTNANKVISTNQIDCSGSLRVTLALTATPDIMSNPTDIVLALDRSGSMTGAPLAAMKTGADTFIDIIAQATGGARAGHHHLRHRPGRLGRRRRLPPERLGNRPGCVPCRGHAGRR